MKAVYCTAYGPPEVLQIKEVPIPKPNNNEILVKIKATAVNSGDVRVRGLAVEGVLKIIMRLVLGFTKPRKPVLGTVFSGIVVQTGSNISNFKVGDKVFGITGFKFGTYAEYIVLNTKSIIEQMPVNASFEEAAALPFGGHTAIDFLQKAKINQTPNPDVLIYGSTGAVGTAAIQIAKHYGASITAVCSEAGKNLVARLGVSNIILYDKEDFTRYDKKFDIILDAVGKTTKKQCAPLLNKGGRYVTVGGMDVATEKPEQLQLLKELFEADKYNATIDKIFPLDEIVDANRYVDSGKKKGNVIIRV